jgi:hypothetical protein
LSCFCHERAFLLDFHGDAVVVAADGFNEGVEGADAGELERGGEAAGEEEFRAEALGVEVVAQRADRLRGVADGNSKTGERTREGDQGSVTLKRKKFLPLGDTGSGISVRVSVDW